MKKPLPFSFTARLASFKFAIEGITTLLREEHNARVHLAAALAVIVFGIALDITRHDWALLVLAIALVWITEALNTSVEVVCNLVTTEQHPLVKKAKDVAAAAVLLSAVAAVLIGLLVFVPYL